MFNVPKNKYYYYFSTRSRVKGYLELYLAYVPEHEPGTSGRLSADGEWEMIENAEILNITHIPSVSSKYNL